MKTENGRGMKRGFLALVGITGLAGLSYAQDAKPESKPDGNSKPEAQAEAKSVPKVAAKPEPKPEPMASVSKADH